jgi:hypothetical protein
LKVHARGMLLIPLRDWRFEIGDSPNTMPFVRIPLCAGSREFRRPFGLCLPDDARDDERAFSARFRVITEHDAEGLIDYDPDYLDVHRTGGILFIQVT